MFLKYFKNETAFRYFLKSARSEKQKFKMLSFKIENPYLLIGTLFRGGEGQSIFLVYVVMGGGGNVFSLADMETNSKKSASLWAVQFLTRTTLPGLYAVSASRGDSWLYKPTIFIRRLYDTSILNYSIEGDFERNRVKILSFCIAMY